MNRIRRVLGWFGRIEARLDHIAEEVSRPVLLSVAGIRSDTCPRDWHGLLVRPESVREQQLVCWECGGLCSTHWSDCPVLTRKPDLQEPPEEK